MVEETDFKFDDKLRQQIHYDWGKYYKRLGKNESAKKQFVDSLSLKENAHGPMEQLSKCYLERGDASKALELANQCLKNHPKITREKYHRNECIYDSNEFETCLVERYRMYHEKKPVLGSIDAIKMTELTLENSIGNQTGSFLNNFRSAITELDKIKAEVDDARPLWKIRREKKECDVLSVCSDSKELTKSQTIEHHPLELQRLRRKQIFFRSMYFSTPTIETQDYFKSLTDDHRLNFPPSKESTKFIRDAIEEELEVFKKFEKMLHQRHPIYAKKILQCKKNSEKFNDFALSRMQKTTENRAKSQLKRIQTMKDTNFSGLLAFVEDIMTNFYLIKSAKVFPKKSEFVDRIYNIIGACYIDKIQIPPRYHPSHIDELFDSALSYRHGYVIPKKFNLLPGFKIPNDHFLKRLQYSDSPIEKCYIFHQLSRLYFEQEKFTESKEMGEELIRTSRSINNDTWLLLGYFRVMLVDATLGEVDYVKTNLEAAKTLNVGGELSNVLNQLQRLISETGKLKNY